MKARVTNTAYRGKCGPFWGLGHHSSPATHLQGCQSSMTEAPKRKEKERKWLGLEWKKKPSLRVQVGGACKVCSTVLGLTLTKSHCGGQVRWLTWSWFKIKLYFVMHMHAHACTESYPSLHSFGFFQLVVQHWPLAWLTGRPQTTPLHLGNRMEDRSLPQRSVIARLLLVYF